MKNEFRNTFLGLSVLYIIFGLIMIIWPDTAKIVICIAAGCICVVFGMVRIVNCWRGDSLGLLDGGAVTGVILVIAGVLIFLKRDAMVSILMAAIGIGIVADGFIKLQLAFMLRRMGMPGWRRDLIAAVVMMAIGVALVFDPFAGARAMTIIVGVILVLDGLVNGWIAAELKSAEKPANQ